MERHPTDAVSLVFGLLFTVVAVIGLTDLLRLTETDVRWAGPGLLVLLGIVLVLTAGRRRSSANGEADAREPAATATRAASRSGAGAAGSADGEAPAADAQADDPDSLDAPDDPDDPDDPDER